MSDRLDGTTDTPEDTSPSGSRPAATPRVLLGLAAAGLLAAAVVPFAPLGINVLIVALAGGAAVYAARPRGLSPTAWMYTGLGVALAATATVRAAEWLLALNLLGALYLAGLAAGAATTWRDILLAPFGVLARMRLVPRFLASGVPRPVRDPGVARRGVPAMLRSAAIVAVVLVVFGTLFASADRAFADLTARVFAPGWDLSSLVVRTVMFAVTLLAVATLAVTRLRPPGERMAGAGALPGAPGLRLGRLEWTSALVALDLLFAVFVGIQIAVLFGGHDHVLRTAGLTYAEYAREGFFQLLVVALLTLAVVAGAVRFGVRERRRDVRRMQLLAGTLCALTLVVLASAVHRLSVYQETFGYTRDRLAVQGILWWVAGILVVTMAAGAVWSGRWLPRAVVAWTAGALLLFTAVNPDGLVAERNIGRHARSGRIGLGYLRSSMSADAVPALLTLPEPIRSCALRPLAEELERDEPWFGFNLARARARTLLDGADLDHAGACPPAGVSP
jgi:hypothetical protein